MVLLMSTSVTMAQFGDLDDILNGANKPKSNNDSTATVNTSNSKYQLIEKALVDGFFCLKQDFQLEDTTTGKRYNHADDPKRFGGQTSFVVLLDNEYIVPDELIHPWDYDPNYSDYKGQKYAPVIHRSSVLKVGQTGWKTKDVYNLGEEASLDNGLKYAVDESSEFTGLKLSSSFGKKTVWVVWLLFSESDSDAKCEFLTSQIEMNINQEEVLYKMEKPDTKLPVLGGIVVEPVVKGIGSIDLELVGVINKSSSDYQMASVVR